MRSLLSYSRRHFDPALPPEEHSDWDSSASILARTLHAILSELGEVTYIDNTDPSSIVGQKFDVFIGVPNNFKLIRDSIQLSNCAIYFAVNMHPGERNRLLARFVRANALTRQCASSWEIADEAQADAALRAADHIICLGNASVWNSFLSRSVPIQKIKMLNYATLAELNVDRHAARKPGPRRFAYPCSDIGLRKGFDVLCSLLSEPGVADLDFKLDIIGFPYDVRCGPLVEQLVRKWPGKVEYHGWLSSSSAAYRELLADADFVVSTSLEEGQAGTVLDGLSQGAIPLVTHNTGIDFSPAGFLEPECRSEANVAIWKRCCEMTDAEIARFKGHARTYNRDFHAAWKENLRDTLLNCIENGRIWPKLSVILPIHNKAQTIRGLLHKLHAACCEYGNVELHILFDGCTDNSEQITRSFFARRKAYPVACTVTPNIFEVKTNNLGLKAATGAYCAVMQDDNFINDPHLFFEPIAFMEKNRGVAIMGCLAGVNFYPRGTQDLSGSGQIECTENEVYWRQDQNTDPALADSFFQVDACMRGPLIFRKQFLDRHGYLDEVYAPLYQDDMDICMRAASVGQKVFCVLGDVENRRLTTRSWDAERHLFFAEVMRRNTDEFYRRWTPGTDKSEYVRYNRTRLAVPKQRKGFAERIAESELRLSLKVFGLIAFSYRVKRKLIRLSRRTRNSANVSSNG